MPPKKSKKRLSTASKDSDLTSPKPASMELVRSPDRSPIRKRVQITQRQKQALLDNLQLEVTKRARKLRAQYVLQAQSLRTRVERRVHRIPANLLKVKMGELLLKYAETQEIQKKDREPPAAVKVSSKSDVQKGALVEVVEAQVVPVPNKPALGREIKRKRFMVLQQMLALEAKRTPFSTDLDKENNIPTSPRSAQTITTPKKRAKPNPHTTTTAVLSPKSSNSRTLPASPFKDNQKPSAATPRPQSPLKPVVSPTKSAITSPAKAAALAATSSLANLVTDKFKSKSTRAAAVTATATVTRKPSARQLKKDEAETAKAAEPKTTTRQKGAKVASAVAAALRTVSGASNSSNASNATTVITKKGATKAGAAAKRVPSMTTAKAPSAKKAPAATGAATKKTAAKVEVPAQGRRVLRKRG